MLDLNNYTHILIIILTCFAFCFLITFYIKKIAVHIGAMDIPDKRKVHTKPMPRLGGLGIFLTFLFGYILFGVQSPQMNAILIGAFIIIIVGVIDDIRPLGAWTKLIGQIASALVVIFYGGILLDKITVLGMHLDFGIFSYLLTILFIVGCINIINLIDGLDGLSTGTCSIFYLTIGIIAFIKASYGGLDVSLSFIMLGASLGFLCHNFYPAKIFSGDSGSMFQGYMIATISLLGFKTVTMTSFIIPILLLGIPILDTLFAIIRRIIKRKPIYMPDKAHLHHQLLNLGLSHRDTVLAIYAMNILFAFASVVYAINDKTLGLIIYIIILILIILIITKTSIIADKRKKK